MKRKIISLILLPIALSITGCKTDDKKEENPLLFNVLDYKTLIISVNGVESDKWDSDNSGRVDRLLKYHSKLILEVHDKFFEVSGTYTYSNQTKSYNLVYSEDYSYKLEK